MATTGPFDFKIIQAAVNEITVLWLGADPGLRAEITAAMHNAEQILKYDADSKGVAVAVDSPNRMIYVPPLAVFYWVGPDEVSGKATAFVGSVELAPQDP